MAKSLPDKKEIIKRIEAAGLSGRGGAAFPLAQKWQAVADSLKSKKGAYIIVNGAEGEPGMKKDAHVLAHAPEAVVDGIFLADRFLGPSLVKKIFFYLDGEYYRDYHDSLRRALAKPGYRSLAKKVVFFVKPKDAGYIGGEEGAIINIIEKGVAKPRLRPPYPTANGLFRFPTLVNNVESFHDASLVVRGLYDEKKFYSLGGAVRHRGAFRLPLDLTIKEILQQTDNWPDFPFFVQAGGAASGELFRSDQLERPLEGAASITVYDEKKTDKKKLLAHWLDFFAMSSCGNCSTCREGSYRLRELARDGQAGSPLFREIMLSLSESSFCALGRSLPLVLDSYFSNILKDNIKKP